MFEKRKKISSIKNGQKSFKMKIYATLRTLGLISVVIFGFDLYVDGLSVFVNCMFLLSVSNSLLTILHTHKRCGFCLRKARVPDTNSIIFMFLCLCKKSNWKTPASAGEWTKYSTIVCLKQNVCSKLHIYQIRLRINFEKVACFTCEMKSRNCFMFKWSIVLIVKKTGTENAFVCFEFLSCMFRSIVQVYFESTLSMSRTLRGLYMYLMVSEAGRGESEAGFKGSWSMHKWEGGPSSDRLWTLGSGSGSCRVGLVLSLVLLSFTPSSSSDSPLHRLF